MNSYGSSIKVSIFGQSHSPEIGMTLEGIPAGRKIDLDELQKFMNRRAPGKSYSTSRKEPDVPEFVSGLVGGVTCGAPITAIIRNKDTRPSDYSNLADIPRPGHADYTAAVKYGDARDKTGGGQFSGRLTAPLCIAGGILIQLLRENGVKIRARALSIGNVKDSGAFPENEICGDFPAVSRESAGEMLEVIERARSEGDSVGGVIECVITGVKPGAGGPMFGGLENRIASAVFGIPAVKGIEFGRGFESACIKGSEMNDPFYFDEEGNVKTKTNNCGGILGGIADGMPITFRVAVKPTPSIAKPQQSVDLKTGENVTMTVNGRHDPCIVPRAVPAVEAAAAIAVYDAIAAG
ncbi:MAG: chorismate synthase [Clostridia bacterium]|nr:chorismate synthase [Clostridia bacterium]